jgi:RNA polymerase sigma factor (sigma-70 family)
MLRRFSAAQDKTHNDTEESLLLRDKEALIWQAVDQLPPQQKAVYLLSRQQGLSYEQIAQELALSPNTVRNHLVKALQSIRHWLQQQDKLPAILLACTHLFIKK